MQDEFNPRDRGFFNMSHELVDETPERKLVFAIINRAIADSLAVKIRIDNDHSSPGLRARRWLYEATIGIKTPQSLRWWLSFITDDIDAEVNKIFGYYLNQRAGKGIPWVNKRLRIKRR